MDRLEDAPKGRWRRRLSRRSRALPRRRPGLWPQLPLALLIIANGALNILAGLHYRLATLERLATLTATGEALAALGSGTQVIVGSGLVLVGLGLLWRWRAAWSFALFLLAVIIGVGLLRHSGGPSIYLSGALLLALIIFRRHFTRTTVVGTYLVSMLGILAIFCYGTFGSYLLGGGFHPAIPDLTTAFYYTVVTLSTVGYGDITPVSDEARLFAVSLLVFGLSIFATALLSSLGPALSGQLAHVLFPREKPMKPTDHVIVIGEGSIARNTTQELAARGVPLVQLIEPGSEPALPDCPVITGDASEDAVLLEAGVMSARMVIAAKEEDVENAFITLAAKDLNPKVRVLAVATSARAMHRLRLARSDLVFAPAVVGSRLLANLVEGGTVPAEFQDLLEGRAHKH